MRLIKIGLVNLDTTVGAIETNTQKAIEYARQLTKDGCTIVAFPEQTLSGYPTEDLIQWKGFVQAQWNALKTFAKATKVVPPAYHRTVFVLGVTVGHRGALYNAAAIICGGEVIGIVPKEKLPTYGVFYEQRTFSAGIPDFASDINGIPFGDLIFGFPFGSLGVEVCEDIWSPDGPLRRRAYSGAEVVVNISASPWRTGVLETRREMIATRAGDNLVTLVYVNQVGGNDGLVFDGGGFVNQCGRTIFEAKRWREGSTTTVVDLDRITRHRSENTTWRTDQHTFFLEGKVVRKLVVRRGPAADSLLIYPRPETKNFFLPSDVRQPSPREEYYENLIEAMILGLKGYFEKTGVFDHIGIALSGGKDSALTLLLARTYAERRFCHLIGKKRREAIYDFIHCFSLPTRFNSETTKTIARSLAEELGVAFHEVPIEDGLTALHEITCQMNGGNEISPTSQQNVQARIRGTLMWTWANTTRGMWLQTGNMSERAVGYTTIGGDLMGAYSLIGNLPKTVIMGLLEHLALKKYPRSTALKDLLMTQASAELRENQRDEEDLMPFEVLDACYWLFAGEKMMPVDVYKALCSMFGDNFSREELKAWIITFTKLFLSSIFKWVQAPQTVHLGSLDLDRERALQLPVVQSDEWLMLNELQNAR